MKTSQEKRRADRDRKRRQRAKAKTLRVPSRAAVNRAVSEATAFALLTAPVNAEWRPADGWRPISVDTIIDTAVQILTLRQRFDPARSRAAVKAVLAPRPQWRWPSHIPTTNPTNVEIGVTQAADAA